MFSAVFWSVSYSQKCHVVVHIGRWMSGVFFKLQSSPEKNSSSIMHKLQLKATCVGTI